jgi:hypothetical protein
LVAFLDTGNAILGVGERTAPPRLSSGAHGSVIFDDAPVGIP